MYPDPRWEVVYHQFRSDERGNVVFSLAFCKALYGVGAYLGTKTARLYDVNGRLCGSIHTVRDLTLERKMEKSLQRSESMHRAIADFAGMGIMLASENEIIYCNKQLKDFLGVYQEHNIHKEDFISWVLPEHRKIVRNQLPVLSSGTEGPVRFEFKSRDGRDYRALAQRIEYEGKAAVHLILDDITEQKLMAEKARLNELRLYHQDRLTALGTMAAGIAHELNQPLNTIRVVTDGFLFGREEGWDLDEDEFFESMEMVSRQVIRMTDVIQNIRDFSREDREGLLSDVDANQAFKNVFSMIGRQLEAHGIDIRKNFDPEIPAIRANLHRLEQVIMNLLVNARQALDQCYKDRKIIQVKTSAANGRILIEVSDNAGGISTEIYDKIFQPFFTTKDAGMGTGLGLSICQSIIAEFDGYFEVYNNEMGGATFIVILPAGEES
jgi:PAS domain S-box-containing protein